MSDETSMSIATASKTARENPDDAASAIQTLFDYVDNGGTDAQDAAVSLSLVAGRAPEAFDGQTDNFEHALKTADGVHARRDLTDAVTELIDHHAIPPGDAGRALTEATRIRDDAYWEDRPKSELLIIRMGLDGWTEVAASGEPVPDIVVERALGLIETRNFNTLISIIDVLQSAVASDSPEAKRAFQTLVEIAQADDPTLTSEATLAVAELVLSGDIPDEDAARDVITANADAVEREQQTIANAQAEITS
jgi:hypothetical protein